MSSSDMDGVVQDFLYNDIDLEANAYDLVQKALAAGHNLNEGFLVVLITALEELGEWFYFKESLLDLAPITSSQKENIKRALSENHTIVHFAFSHSKSQQIEVILETEED